MWRRVSCELQSDLVSDLLWKLERFRHAVVEPSCGAVFSALWRDFAVFVVFLPLSCE